MMSQSLPTAASRCDAFKVARMRGASTRVDGSLVRHFAEEAFLVFHVPQVPKFNRVVNRGRRQQPVASGVELCVGHFGFVQFVAENLKRQTAAKRLTLNCRRAGSRKCDGAFN